MLYSFSTYKKAYSYNHDMVVVVFTKPILHDILSMEWQKLKNEELQALI